MEFDQRDPQFASEEPVRGWPSVWNSQREVPGLKSGTARVIPVTSPVGAPEVGAPLGTAYGILNESIVRLENVSRTLEARLAPVLSPNGPMPGHAEAPRVGESPLVEALMQAAERVNSTADYLIGIRDRLEV